MNLEVSYLSNNECYRQAKKITPQGIVVHSVGCAQPNRKAFVNSWNTNNLSKCVHAFVDDTGISQTLPWDYKCWGCGSGTKGSYNNSHIQFEICEPAGTKYQGSKMLNYDTEKNQDFFNKCYNNAVELCAYLCNKFNISPSNIVCHKEANKLGYASNHEDVEHWFPLHQKNMNTLRADVIMYINKNYDNNKSDPNNIIEEAKEETLTRIDGDNILNKEQMIKYIQKQNSSDIDWNTLIDLYIKEAETEGIRYDIAFCQSILETGNFKYVGSAVEFSDNNFAGLGVTQTGIKGNIYPSQQLGIRAQIQHLKAYTNTLPLVNECIDARFKYVERGCAPYVEWLGQKENPKGKGWATGKDYGYKILNILNNILKQDTSNNQDNKNDFVNYTVKVLTELNIRSGPGTSYNKVGCIRDNGIYTIVDQVGTWGKLKSGTGWISLNYTKRV